MAFGGGIRVLWTLFLVKPPLVCKFHNGLYPLRWKIVKFKLVCLRENAVMLLSQTFFFLLLLLKVNTGYC